ncbi:MAG: hypothetical protein O7C66_03420, partial [Alphaproteobacteria bacterium]|nr:hypothetical protein [Alphaproteobacteria bacterium]
MIKFQANRKAFILTGETPNTFDVGVFEMTNFGNRDIKRLIPEWNPFDRRPGLQRQIGVEWPQFVPFAAIGRVAPTWDIEELHTDMKWDLGLGIRAWAKGFVVR